MFSSAPPDVPVDTNKLPNVIINIVKGEGAGLGKGLPISCAFGADPTRWTPHEQLRLLDAWEEVSSSVTVEGRREMSRWLLNGCSILNKSESVIVIAVQSWKLLPGNFRRLSGRREEVYIEHCIRGWWKVPYLRST